MQQGVSQFRESPSQIGRKPGGVAERIERECFRDQVKELPMTARLMIAVALVIGGIASPVKAIEMFTNFNYGTELGTRPYGIEVLSPVRYHAYPHRPWLQGMTPPCPANAGPEMRPANNAAAKSDVPDRPSTASRPEIRRPNVIVPSETTARRAATESEEGWIRSSNFLPPAQAE
jgi:hypothetical protein